MTGEAGAGCLGVVKRHLGRGELGCRVTELAGRCRRQMRRRLRHDRASRDRMAAVMAGEAGTGDKGMIDSHHRLPGRGVVAVLAARC